MASEAGDGRRRVNCPSSGLAGLVIWSPQGSAISGDSRDQLANSASCKLHAHSLWCTAYDGSQSRIARAARRELACHADGGSRSSVLASIQPSPALATTRAFATLPSSWIRVCFSHGMQCRQVTCAPHRPDIRLDPTAGAAAGTPNRPISQLHPCWRKHIRLCDVPYLLPDLGRIAPWGVQWTLETPSSCRQCGRCDMVAGRQAVAPGREGNCDPASWICHQNRLVGVDDMVDLHFSLMSSREISSSPG